MLKKIISSGLSALMLTSCIGGSVKAVLPDNHIQHIVEKVQNGGFYPYESFPDLFEENLFKKICFISYFTRNENNKRLGSELIRKLFKAELSGTYAHTYNQLLTQYNGNVAVQNALEEIDGFVGRAKEVNIEFNETMFLYDEFPIVDMEKTDPEFLNSLKNMPRKLQITILRLESLRSLYYLIHDPKHLLDKDIQNLPTFYPIFRPWIDNRGLVTQQGYHRLLSDLFLISAYLYKKPDLILILANRRNNNTVYINFDRDTLFSDDDGREFSRVIDKIDKVFINHNI